MSGATEELRELSVSPLFDLRGRRVLVTGASRGIGRALAVGLAEHGADIYCVARDGTNLEQTAEMITAGGGRAITRAASLRGEDAIRDTVRAMAAEMGGIDVLVNNAADDHDSMLEETDLETWRRVLDLNLDSVFLLCREAAPHLQQSGRGKVINIASIMSSVAMRGNGVYITGKAAIAGFTRALALEWARKGVQVNALAPGFIETDMTEPMWSNDRGREGIAKRTPIGRWGKTQDLVGAAVFLAGSASDFMTGQLLYVDGGYLIQ
jgi:NAD(P)-dependent dehydrogenase (short-subunit alcohol dehydrogenase family)